MPSPSPTVRFLVCALFYGDHVALATRCGTTLAALRATGRVDLLLGLNEVCPASMKRLGTLLPGVTAIHAAPQIFKYPMMRRLLGSYAGPATHLMWFDDDSCLLPEVDAQAWIHVVERAAAQVQGSLGPLYFTRLSASRRAWVRAQPWFRGRELPDVLPFTGGGWFVAPLALLRALDWPQGLRHNGGDVGFGALVHQLGLEPVDFRTGLAINAGADLREGSAARRGFSEPPPTTSEQPSQ